MMTQASHTELPSLPATSREQTAPVSGGVEVLQVMLMTGGLHSLPPRFSSAPYSYGHLLVITGYKWDYTIYKWGYKYL